MFVSVAGGRFPPQTARNLSKQMIKKKTQRHMALRAFTNSKLHFYLCKFALGCFCTCANNTSSTQSKQAPPVLRKPIHMNRRGCSNFSAALVKWYNRGCPTLSPGFDSLARLQNLNRGFLYKIGNTAGAGGSADVGSSPSTSTIILNFYGVLRSQVARQLWELDDGGSNPSTPTTNFILIGGGC